MVFKLGLAGVESRVAMLVNTCFAAHFENALDVFEFDFVFRRLAFGVVGVVVRNDKVLRIMHYPLHLGSTLRCGLLPGQ